MRKITVNKKTVFFTHDKPLNIYDERGLLFYSSDFVKKFKGFFSLPRGVYYTNNRLQLSSMKINSYEKIQLPKIERDLKHDWDTFKIIFDDNPNKCSINHKTKTITYDNSFKKQPLYILYFILFHEMGHNYYQSEIGADIFAVKKMLKEGFTPSQIGLSPLKSLSKSSDFRKKIIIDTILKNSKK